MTRQPLPIDDVIAQLRAVLAHGARAVLQAPPGAGKTTVVPVALADEAWAGSGRIVMLEPRRLAARAAARRMAALANERVGGRIGFRVRGETLVGPSTRIEVVTEGVLTRMLATDPTLDGVAAVIFDEFHERSLVADTGLALTLRTADLVRPDLRLLVMSATLDGTATATLLGGAPVITSVGRTHPVTTRWIAVPARKRPLDGVAAAVRRAVSETDGDVLVFVPGAAEIRRLSDSLAAEWPSGNPAVYGLHGSMTAEMQDAAIGPSPVGRRKVVVASAIAETSLTIEGVRAVVDSGFARVPRFDVRSGMSRLETVRVTQDAAEQRRGRAGRTAPGVCYRLWSEAEHAALLSRRTPEILSADLAPLALELALAGVDDPADLRWLDVPPAAALSQARTLLFELDALDERGAATAHGRRLASLGVHPRVAHLVMRGSELGLTRLACEIAALLGERDIVRGGGPAADPDLSYRLALLRGDCATDDTAVDRGGLMRVRDEARRIRERVAGLDSQRAASRDDLARAGELLALAYPDRVALARTSPTGGAAKRQPGGFRMRNGRGAQVAAHSPLARERALAIAETDGAPDDARVFLAAALDPAAIERLFKSQIVNTTDVALDERTGLVTRTERRAIGALVLAEHTSRATDREAVTTAFLGRVRRDGIGAIPWSDASANTRRRLAFMHALDPAWPDVGDAALLATLDAWLAPHLSGLSRWADIGRTDLGGALLGLVPAGLRRHFERLAPAHVRVASGSDVPVDYSDPRAPVLAVRLQELFGTVATPTVADGRVPLTLQLLSPARRPIQVTRDLAGFWSGSYADVRKAMRGRYPRHPWPDDPMAAKPTLRAKPRK